MNTSTLPVAPLIDTSIRGNHALPRMRSRVLGCLVCESALSCASAHRPTPRIKWTVHSRMDGPGRAMRARTLPRTRCHDLAKTHLNDAPSGQGAVK